MNRVLLVILSICALCVLCHATTHAPPLRSRRAPGTASLTGVSRTTSATRAGPAGYPMATPSPIAGQVQWHLQQLEQLSRLHLQSWMAGQRVVRPQIPQIPQVPQVPQVPQAPQVPQVSQVPQVPQVPQVRPQQRQRPQQPQRPQAQPQHQSGSTSTPTVSPNQAMPPPEISQAPGPGTQPDSATGGSGAAVAGVAQKKPQGPSKCVFAIVTCCQPSTPRIRYSCFELLDCVGAFWDNSPCETDTLRASLAQVGKYYRQGGKTQD